MLNGKEKGSIETDSGLSHGCVAACMLYIIAVDPLIRRMAKRKVIESVSTDDLGVNLGESQVNIDSHDSPPEKPPGQKFEGAESVRTVVLKLREEANVI